MLLKSNNKWLNHTRDQKIPCEKLKWNKTSQSLSDAVETALRRKFMAI